MWICGFGKYPPDGAGAGAGDGAGAGAGLTGDGKGAFPVPPDVVPAKCSKLVVLRFSTQLKHFGSCGAQGVSKVQLMQPTSAWSEQAAQQSAAVAAFTSVISHPLAWHKKLVPGLDQHFVAATAPPASAADGSNDLSTTSMKLQPLSASGAATRRQVGAVTRVARAGLGRATADTRSAEVPRTPIWSGDPIIMTTTMTMYFL
eukprot:COSAG02_NODE_1669_length_11402_cov_9.442007_5_plen_202_part_00